MAKILLRTKTNKPRLLCSLQIQDFLLELLVPHRHLLFMAFRKWQEGFVFSKQWWCYVIWQLLHHRPLQPSYVEYRPSDRFLYQKQHLDDRLKPKKSQTSARITSVYAACFKTMCSKVNMGINLCQRPFTFKVKEGSPWHFETLVHRLLRCNATMHSREKKREKRKQANGEFIFYLQCLQPYGYDLSSFLFSSNQADTAQDIHYFWYSLKQHLSSVSTCMDCMVLPTVTHIQDVV